MQLSNRSNSRDSSNVAAPSSFLSLDQTRSERQAIQLGRKLRHELYPDAPGGGILRLHSTFRHDLKIKTSDEGRVMKTGAAFAKGLLELEGDLPPILVSLVHKEKGSMHMLDPSGKSERREGSVAGG